MPLIRSTRLNWPRWWAAVAFLILGPVVLVGPYVAVKGGLGTKPAIARLLGTAPKSAPGAVERARPLDPHQSTAKTYLLATRAMAEAVRDSVTIPLLPLVLVGLLHLRLGGDRGRIWLFLAIINLAAVAALVRLHATGGYCSPRHAMVLAFLLIPTAAFGLDRLLHRIAIPARWFGLGDDKLSPGPAVWVLLLAGFVAWNTRPFLEPIGAGFGGYRRAAAYLSKNAPPDEKVVDVTGWSLYYAHRSGYTFANLIEAPGNPNVRWVVARDAHLKGPWLYCIQLRQLVAGLEPVETYVSRQGKYLLRVYVFDRQAKIARGGPRGDRESTHG
jgi:hypothetical protein